MQFCATGAACMYAGFVISGRLLAERKKINAAIEHRRRQSRRRAAVRKPGNLR